jgi:hypothetical protein
VLQITITKKRRNVSMHRGTENPDEDEGEGEDEDAD